MLSISSPLSPRGIGTSPGGREGASRKVIADDTSTDDYEGSLLKCLQVIPHHAIGLRRNKYRVVRRISNLLNWTIVKDAEASIVWLDKWSMNDLANLRLYKVRPECNSMIFNL